MVLFYAVTLFVSATLLFVIQPMVGKTILPLLGGTPAVWNTCLLFFQAVLLAGYAYAHGSVALLKVRRQAGLHVLLLLVPLFLLPITVIGDMPPPTGASPVAWLLLRLIVSVGPPLFLVSSTAPLLQKWFAQTGHASARDPYFLYAASNGGSLLALLGYPLFIEPNFFLAEQNRYWSMGYVLLVAMVLGCAVWMRLSSGSTASTTLLPSRDLSDSGRDGSDEKESERLTNGRRLRWVWLTIIPSSLLLGVTTHITTNVAAVPLLWVLPLAIYLSTFILVFARKPLVPHSLIVRVMPYVVLSLGPVIFVEVATLRWLDLPLHLAAFFVIAMLCHGELVRSRPTAGHLTEFYLWVSVGGVLGGFFNAIVAPLVFNTIVEYPLVLVLSCFVLPAKTAPVQNPRQRRYDFAFPAMLAAFCYGTLQLFKHFEWQQSWYALGSLITVTAIVCFGFKDRPKRFGLGFAVFLTTLAGYTRSTNQGRLLVERNFFGVKRVLVDSAGRFHALVNGNVNHGMQWIDPARRDEPTSYYHRKGPVGDIFASLHERGLPHRVAVIGLGAGALACYARPGEHFTFYEIDPAVDRIAHNRAYFTFLSDCRGTCEVVLGDGRLSLSQAPDGRYGLMILDAFSSDAIPTHLLSAEAVDRYLEKLNEHGILAFHISNSYLNLAGVVANLAQHAGLVCLERVDTVPSAQRRLEGRLPSDYVVMARRSQDLGSLVDKDGWEPLPPDPRSRLWTDQFCDILSVYRAPRAEARTHR